LHGIDRPELDLYSAVVWHVSLKREIRLVYLVHRRPNRCPRTCLLFSTDVQQDPMQIYQCYKLRFQIEFIFRDAKQFTGLADCQARDALKLEFHFNASLTALNLAKLEARQQHSSAVPVCIFHGDRQAMRPQSPFAGAIYLQLRPGTESNQPFATTV
jgi:hypothetical protein